MEAADDGFVDILPYSRIVGQDEVKLALELAYVSPRIGGVLISGQRGTAKSTTARAFARLAYRRLPVTLPINATDDRVLGGWRVDELMRGRAEPQPGLLEDAGGSGLLYVDEVNLLDDHLVNILLDVASTGLLTVQREALDVDLEVSFVLVGTMNPEEGGLRPQLLDRFGLMASVTSERDVECRRRILEAVLALDEAKATGQREWLDAGRSEDDRRREELEAARGRLYEVNVPSGVKLGCARIAAEFSAAGNRADYIMALAARALAARDSAAEVRPDHVGAVAKLALQHRRGTDSPGVPGEWTSDDQTRVDGVLAGL